MQGLHKNSMYKEAKQPLCKITILYAEQNIEVQMY